MAFCSYCGTQVQDTQKFCASCGNPLKPLTYAPNPGISQPPVIQNVPAPGAAPAYFNETVRFVISNLYISKSWGRADNYTLIVTERRSIFAKLTQQIVNENIKQSRANAANEGKGFFGKWAAQMTGFYDYTKWYSKYTPDQVLQETEGNFSIDNAVIRRIRISDDSDEDSSRVEYGVEFQMVNNKLYFKSSLNSESQFKQAYGNVVVK
jgi:zinc-ribbon domain